MTGASGKRWQFSTRSLLLLTAIVSAILALAVSLPIWFQAMIWVAIPVLIVVALFQSANFLTSDRRPRLAILSWTMLAGFFGFYSAAILSLYFARTPASDEITSRTGSSRQKTLRPCGSWPRSSECCLLGKTTEHC